MISTGTVGITWSFINCRNTKPKACGVSVTDRCFSAVMSKPSATALSIRWRPRAGTPA
ncbi:hypothetical protein D3C72_2211320 [compost metagenome]